MSDIDDLVESIQNILRIKIPAVAAELKMIDKEIEQLQTITERLERQCDGKIDNVAPVRACLRASAASINEAQKGVGPIEAVLLSAISKLRNA